MGQHVMHDESADEPKPKRRSTFRHARGGLALVVVTALSLFLLERAGIIDSGSLVRHVRALFGGGREEMRKQVFWRMTRKDVEDRIGTGGESLSFVTMSGGVGPGPIRQAHPTQFCRIPYREYGFEVVYFCRDINDPESWTVSAVEDLE
jgi:hypothetical protein